MVDSYVTQGRNPFNTVIFVTKNIGAATSAVACYEGIWETACPDLSLV